MLSGFALVVSQNFANKSTTSITGASYNLLYLALHFCRNETLLYGAFIWKKLGKQLPSSQVQK
jgi:hypothetical protein